MDLNGNLPSHFPEGCIILPFLVGGVGISSSASRRYPSLNARTWGFPQELAVMDTKHSQCYNTEIFQVNTTLHHRYIILTLGGWVTKALLHLTVMSLKSDLITELILATTQKWPWEIVVIFPASAALLFSSPSDVIYIVLKCKYPHFSCIFDH